MASSPNSNHNVPAHPASAPGRHVVRGLLAVVLVLGAASSAAHDRWWPHLHRTNRAGVLPFGCQPEDEEEYEGGNPREREAAKPRVESVTIISTPHRGDTYGLGEWMRVRVRFDKTISVTGGPTLTLEIGPTRCGSPRASSPDSCRSHTTRA